MKILHLIPSMGSGGAERQLSVLATALSEKGLDCHIGYCSDGPNLERLSAGMVSIHQFSLKNNHDPRLLLHIIRLIRAVKPDLIQTWLLQMDVMGGLAAVLTGVPFILSERSSASCYPNNWKFFLRKKMADKASSIIANSQGGIDYWRSLKTETPLFLIRNCVQTDGQLADLQEQLPGEPRLIVVAGRLSPEKNVILLLDALIVILKKSYNTRVKIFGEGPLKEQLQVRINQQQMADKISLEGYTQNLPAWLSRAELCVSISDYEGNPNVVLEAAAAECPLVLSDIQAHREIFDDSQVNFVDHKSLEKIISGIQTALEHRESSHSKAVRARDVLTDYSIDKILQQYLDVYHKAVE